MVPITIDAEKLAVAEKHIIQYFFQCTSKRMKMLFLFSFSSFANDDWHCPAARVDLTVGGSFTYTMAARDASFQFDFSGTYTSVVVNERIDVILGDGRLWNTTFEEVEGGVKVTEEFDRENENPEDMQRTGWQMILDRFKSYVELASS
jgi:uncharacterized protein YndB with AHSA1/START domain